MTVYRTRYQGGLAPRKKGEYTTGSGGASLRPCVVVCCLQENRAGWVENLLGRMQSSMSISSLLALLATSPTSLIFHLIRLVILEAGLGLSWYRYRDDRNPADRMAAIAFGAALLLALGPLLLTTQGMENQVWLRGILETLVAGALVWGIALPALGQPLIVRYVPAGFGAGVLGLALLMTDHSIPVWEIGTSVAFGVGAALLVWRRAFAHWSSMLIAFLLLGLAPLPIALAPAVSSALMPAGEAITPATAAGAGRLLSMSGHLVMVAAVYLQSMSSWKQERAAISSEFQTLSRGSLQQTQERLYLQRVSQTIGASLELQTVLETAAESLVMGGYADRVFIALADEKDPDHLWLVSDYTALSRWATLEKQVQFRLRNFSLIWEAVSRKQPVIVSTQAPDRDVVALHTLLGSEGIGPLLVQPLIHQAIVVGLVFMSNVASGRPFGEQDQRFCSALSGQLTSAIANARLYERVTRLFHRGVAEASQRKAILESIADGVIATDTAGIVILANAAAGRVLRLEVEEMTGQTLQALCPLIWMEAGQGQNTFELNDRVIRGIISVIRQPNGSSLGHVAVLRDITQEIQAERAKASFLATVSHELRTPMTAIKGYADLMSNGVGGSLSSTQLDYIEIILANTDRMVHIVNNMITVSEMEGEIDFSPEVMDMGALLRASLFAMDIDLRRRNLRVELKIPNRIPPVLGDYLRLSQIVHNLLSNARKYTYPDGKISINVSTVPAGSFAPNDNGYLVVAVSDTGVGIPPHERSRIFDRFYRVDNPLSVEAGGPGVGLTIARDLIERHGGRIWVDSEVGVGSTFTFIIPLAQDQPIEAGE